MTPLKHKHGDLVTCLSNIVLFIYRDVESMLLTLTCTCWNVFNYCILANGKRMSCALGDKNAYVLNIPYIGKVSSFVGG